MNFSIDIFGEKKKKYTKLGWNFGWNLEKNLSSLADVTPIEFTKESQASNAYYRK